MSVKVSIVLPIYNVEKYLDKCLYTLVNQTLKEIEIICVLDKSPDNSIEICRKWASKDDRIVIIDKPVNEGLGLTRNAGIEVATGEYVAFVDSDDYVNVEMYEKLYSFAKEHNLDASFCNYVRDTDGNIIMSNEPKDTILYLSVGQTRGFMLDMIGPLPSYPSDVKYMVSVWRSIYSMTIIKDNHLRFESERKVVSEDTIWNLDFMSKAERTGYIPFEGYYYRYNNVSLSRTYDKTKEQKLLYLLDLVKERLELYYPGNSSFYKLHYQRMILFIFRIIIKYEAIINPEGKRITNISEILHDKRLLYLYDSYPFGQLSLSKQVFVFCMKHNLIHFLVWISLLDNRKNRVI